jgi:hypothetical protein
MCQVGIYYDRITLECEPALYRRTIVFWKK